MIKILNLLTILSSLTLQADNLFLYDKTNKVEISDIRDNKLNAFTTTIGKTYSLKNSLSVITDTNSECLYVVPHQIVMLQREITSVYFSGDNIQYHNDFTLPSVVKIKESLFNISSNGELYVSSKNTNQNVIGTSMVNISFGKADLFIKSGEKYTQVFVNEGVVTVLDNKSSKKKKELKAGDYLVVTPQIVLNPKDSSLKSLGNSFSIKETEDDEIQAHKKTFDNLQNVLYNTLFVNYETNIFGIKLK